MAYSHVATLTITSSSAQLASTQTNFPVLFRGDANLKTVANGGKATSSSGYDIIFCSANNPSALLDFELVTYSATTGLGEWWVRVPSCSLSLVLYLFVGDSSVTTYQGNTNGTWDTNFKGVYHLPDGTTLTANDSTSSPANGTLTNTPTASALVIDGSANFNAASDQYINLGNPAKLQITGDLTINAWFSYPTAPGNDASFMVVAKDKDTGGRAYTLDIYNGTAGNLYGVGNIVCLRFYISGGSGTQNNGDNIIVGGTGLSVSTTYHVAAVYNASGTLDLYLNGVSDQTQKTGELTAIPSATANALIGRREYAGFTNPITGEIDEVRISATARSADWALACYHSQKTSSTFTTLGSFAPYTAAGKRFVLIP